MSIINSLKTYGLVICTESPVLIDVGNTKQVSFIGVSREVVGPALDVKIINSYFTFVAWSSAAEKIAAELKVGDEFIVLDGTPRVEQWISKDTKEKKSKNIIRVNDFRIIPRVN